MVRFTAMLYSLGRFIALALSLALACSVSLEGQEQVKTPFERSVDVGLRVGGNAARYSFNPSVPQGLQVGYHSGLMARYNIERGASAQIELSYVQTGWSEQFDAEGLSYTRELGYVELPFLTHLYLGEGVVRPFVNIGPYIGLNLSERGSTEGAEELFDAAQRLRQTTEIKNKFAWGLTGGPGLSFRLGARHRLELEGRIVYSFTDVWSNKRTDPYGSSSELRFALSLAYLIRL